jgi:ATP-dependent helicase/nuclease subunit B
MLQPGTLTRTAVSAPNLIKAAAQALVADLRAQLPELRDATVVLPHLHAAADFSIELARAAGSPALILPRITTLSAWASEVPLDRPVVPHAARHAMLYRVLSERGWLADADLWSVAAELALLFDELTRKAVTLPDDLGAFTRQLEHAYRARAGAGFNFEARLVHELWHAAVRGSRTLDPETAYQLRLARLAERVSGPVYAVGLSDLARSETLFFERAAARVAVHCFDADPTGGDGVSTALALAWPREPEYPDLLARSDALRRAEPESPLAGRVKIFGAASAEQEAQAVEVTVRQWLLEGRRSIAVVVNDRVTARRARALLERAQVLVDDEAGWAFSTTSAATSIGRWLDIATNDAYYRDVLDLMKLPFAFFDRPRAQKHSAVWRLERYTRKDSIVSGLDHFIAAAEREHDREVVEMLKRMQRGLDALGRGKRSIARWLASLLASLKEIGVAQGLADDSAGEQLLELLERLRQELADEPFTVTFAQWRQWLARELETATFRDSAIQSPVVFTHLAAARLRRFDGVVLLGCDAAHLPGPDGVALFFNQGVRAELGLDTHVQRVARVERDLAALLASSESTMITWQRQSAGEPNLLSPQLERLLALHRLAYTVELEDTGMAERLVHSDVRHVDSAREPAATARAAAIAPADRIPARISASGYNALLSCPYQFHARYVLGLGELDDVQEEIEKRDYGELVHDILTEFHKAHPRVSALKPEVARSALEALSREAFADLVARNYLARAWLARWLALVPEYLEWQVRREKDGWAWHAGEESRSIDIVTPEGRHFVLHGRLDRVDVNGEGDFSVIDYKTQRPEVLKRKLESVGEDVQLPVYALLWGGPVAAALFLSVERGGGVKEVPLGTEIAQLADATRERLGTMVDALYNASPLVAQGIDAVCQYCEVRGLCRRNYWT